MRLLAFALALAACHRASPDSDCARVKAIAAGAPRRYQGAMIADKLAKATFASADLQAAVRAGDLAKVELLCGPLTGSAADWRRQDCMAVRMYVPSVEDEANGVGIFDPTVPTMTFRDPEIRAAMKELVDSGWSPGWTTMGSASGSSAGSARTPDPRLAKLRALCGYPTR